MTVAIAIIVIVVLIAVAAVALQVRRRRSGVIVGSATTPKRRGATAKGRGRS